MVGRSSPSAGSSDADSAAVRRLAKLFLEDLNVHVEGLYSELIEKIVEYESVPGAEVKASSVAIISAVTEHLTRLRVDAADIIPLGSLARKRAEQGFPPEALTRSIQIGARHVLREVDRIAGRENVDAATMLLVHDVAWQFATDAASVIAEIHHEIAVDIGQRENGHRADFLRAVLHGMLPPEQVKVQARVFGLDPNARYHPLRARPADRREEDRLSLTIRRTCTTHAHRPVIAVVDGDLVAVVPQRPVIDEPSLVAMGDAALLTNLAGSYRAASLALETAHAFRRTGVITLVELGPLPLVLMGGELVGTVESTYFAGLAEDLAGGLDIQRTVWTWLCCDQNVDEVARRLHVHRNTVRYRITRFKEQTSLDLRCTEDLITAWWALGRRVMSGLL